MLAGTRYLTLDAKGRVVVPEHFRRDLGASFIVTRAPDRCLLAVPARRWRSFLRVHASAVHFREFFLSGAVELTPAATTGRVLLPGELREWAELRPGQEVALAGVGLALAIAPKVVWDARLRRIETGLLAALEKPRPVMWCDRQVA
ncbi:MAG: division/cell wall cluster transcriptional repressor MraZ [Actinomycetota bacterium]